MYTYRRRFAVEGRPAEALYRMTMKQAETRLLVDGREVDRLVVLNSDARAAENHILAATLGDGRRLEVELGPVNWLTVGAVARLDGRVIYESHPGRPLGYGPKLRQLNAWATAQDTPAARADLTRSTEAWKRNWPSLATDLALGLTFFFVAREWGLTVAAVGGAIAGLLLWVVQKLTRIDLLGGLAVFGIFMGLLSAGFALAFRDEGIIQYRSTIIGLVGASLFLADGALTRGERLAARMARYFAFDLDVQRLAYGMGSVSVIMALANVIAVRVLSEGDWLVYTTFLDLPLAMGLFLLMISWARKGPNAAAW